MKYVEFKRSQRRRVLSCAVNSNVIPKATAAAVTSKIVEHL